MYTNISGIIRIKKPNGYGFMKATNQSEPYITKDIFFHATNVKQIHDGEVKWDDLKEGMKITAGAVSVTNKGYEALELAISIGVKEKRKARKSLL